MVVGAGDGVVVARAGGGSVCWGGAVEVGAGGVGRGGHRRLGCHNHSSPLDHFPNKCFRGTLAGQEHLSVACWSLLLGCVPRCTAGVCTQVYCFWGGGRERGVPRVPGATCGTNKQLSATWR